MTSFTPENFSGLPGVSAPAGLSNRARIAVALIAGAAHAVHPLPAFRTLAFEIGSEAATWAALIEAQLAGAFVIERRGPFARAVLADTVLAGGAATLWTACPRPGGGEGGATTGAAALPAALATARDRATPDRPAFDRHEV